MIREPLRIAGIIPARYASTRFPGKPLVMIDGKTMIQRVYERASESKLLQKVVVATDDSRIFDHVQQFGGNVIMTSVKHFSGTERCGEAMLAFSDSYNVILNIQGDEPYIKPEMIDLLASSFDNLNVEIATLISPMSNQNEIQNHNVVKVVFDQNMNALYFSRAAIPYVRDINCEDSPSPIYYKHIGMYGYRTDILKKIVTLPISRLETLESLEQLRWLENGIKINVVASEYDSIAVDTPADLEKILNQKTTRN